MMRENSSVTLRFCHVMSVCFFFVFIFVYDKNYCPTLRSWIECWPCPAWSWGRCPSQRPGRCQWKPASAPCTRLLGCSLCRPSTPRTTRIWRRRPDSALIFLQCRGRTHLRLNCAVLTSLSSASAPVSIPGDLSSQVGSLADGEATNSSGIFRADSSLLPLMYFSTLLKKKTINPTIDDFYQLLMSSCKAKEKVFWPHNWIFCDRQRFPFNLLIFEWHFEIDLK